MVKALTYPKNMTASPDYTMTANGIPVYLCELPGWAGGTISIAFIELDSDTEIKISCNSKVKSAKVHPISREINTIVENNTITFHMNNPENLCVLLNDCFSLPVYIFASQFHEALNLMDENLIYFGQGIHNAGMIELKSGQTLWIDEGAVVNGTIKATDASDIKIMGRGIIRTSYMPFGGTPGGPQEVAGFIRCKNVYMEGITILDSFGWTVATYECDDVHIENIRIINERPWSTDGINPCNSANVFIEKCFIRTKDDCITVKGMNAYGRPSNGIKAVEHIIVKDCVFWSDNNNAMVVGSETLAEYMRDIHFIDCDVLKVTGTCADKAGAMSIICLHDGDVSDISFEGINVEYTEAPLINVFYAKEIFRIPGMRKEEGGIVRNLLFRNISLLSGPFRWSYIRGMDEKRRIEHVTIDNLKIFGKKIDSLEDAELETAFVSDINVM